MIDYDDLRNFIKKKCVHANTNLSFASFCVAFQRSLPAERQEEYSQSELLSLMRGQYYFDLHFDGRRFFVVNCTIPGEQREMVGS